MSNKFYGQSRQGSPYYGSAVTEPDMRQELIRMFDGAYPEVPKAQTAMLRKMRRTDAGVLVPCACVDILTQEPDKDVFCPFCHGEGSYWDETYMDMYKVVLGGDSSEAVSETVFGPGLLNVPLTVFYTRYDELITQGDRVVELVLDVEGIPVQPLRRRGIYRISTAIDFRSDNGKLEYWKLDCYQDKRKFLNG